MILVEEGSKAGACYSWTNHIGKYTIGTELRKSCIVTDLTLKRGQISVILRRYFTVRKEKVEGSKEKMHGNGKATWWFVILGWGGSSQGGKPGINHKERLSRNCQPARARAKGALQKDQKCGIEDVGAQKYRREERKTMMTVTPRIVREMSKGTSTGEKDSQEASRKGKGEGEANQEGTPG